MRIKQNIIQKIGFEDYFELAMVAVIISFSLFLTSVACIFLMVAFGGLRL
jgi:hypothetical protein